MWQQGGKRRLNVAPWYIKVSIGMQRMSQSYTRPSPEALFSLISREVTGVVDSKTDGVGY